MRYFLFRNPILRQADDGAGGGSLVGLVDGAEAAAAAAPAGSEGGEPPPQQNAPPPQDGNEPARPSRPDFVPESWWDAEKGEVRLKELVQSHGDLRTKLSQRPGNPPETPEGYTLPPIEGMPDDLVPADDPVWKAVQAAAHKKGISADALQAIALPFLSQAVRERTEGAAAAQAAQVDAAKAELAKLGPNGTQLVKDTAARMRALEASGAISKEELTAFASISNAAGITLVNKLLAGMTPGIIPTEAIHEGNATQADIERALREGYTSGDQAKIEKATRQLQELEKAGRLRVV